MVKLTSQVINALALKISKAINSEVQAHNAKIRNNWKEVEEQNIKKQLDQQLDPILAEFQKIADQYNISRHDSDASWLKSRVVSTALRKSESELDKYLKQPIDFQDIRNEIILSSIDATTIADIEESMRKKFLND